jgi:hypothetical protein
MDDQLRRPHPAIAVIAFLITLAVLTVLAELISSQVLIYRYRHDGTLNDGNISSFVLFKKAAIRLGWMTASDADLRDLESIPAPFQKNDPVFGYSAIPGEYIHVFKRKLLPVDRWKTLPVKVTINSDQSRWTVTPGSDQSLSQSQKPTIYIFGDSYVFGLGVNDEQTFAYLLQMARPNYNVKLFALGGYGLVQSYLRIQQLKSEIKDRDIVIIGYADYYDVRNVAAPSHLRAFELWREARNGQKVEKFARTPKASIGSDNRLSIALVEQDCQVVPDYCNSDDPPLSDMRAVSIRLIREIAKATKAKTYLLHFDGRKDNPVVQNCGIEVISALQEDFGYFIRDTVEDFDGHPGPYWHYAIARKLISKIK